MFLITLPLFALSFTAQAQDYFTYPGHNHVPTGYPEALAAMNFSAVQEDLKTLFLDSQDWWPADYGTYAPFMIRLGWHTSGTYRLSDGYGGADGGLQRFDPERSWDDNTNLDKARELLQPLKDKYGVGLSWGDLFILAGTTAIESMGGPSLGFCGGRIDDIDNSMSVLLGPTSQQEYYAVCEVQGDCQFPFGSTTIGLIYVNPEGPFGNASAYLDSAAQVRDVFGRMSMNDSETLALIGGGHSFGKAHGACPNGAGPPPSEQPANPWPGNCGTGNGVDTFTSGFEGPWTSNPTQFDNKYWQYLRDFSWDFATGPGNHSQWYITNGSQPFPTAISADGSGQQEVLMLTTDISLLYDPEGLYQPIIDEWADDEATFANAFAHAWYKLVTRDMGPYARCAGNLVPEPQPWQNPLPANPSNYLTNFDSVKQDILDAINTPQDNILIPDYYDNVAYYGALLVRLTKRCFFTFRKSDYQGGCNGARIRFSPESDWQVNNELNSALDLLEGIKNKYGNSLSWSDLIVLAGTTAIEQAGGPTLPFCGGRQDATDGNASQAVSWTAQQLDGGVSLATITDQSIFLFKTSLQLLGLTLNEAVALIGGGHSLGEMHVNRSGFTGSWTSSPMIFNNEYFRNLLQLQWQTYTVPATGQIEYQSQDGLLYMTQMDYMLRIDPELNSFVQMYADDNNKFMTDFANAWVKMVTIDRFDGPTGNLCAQGGSSNPSNSKSYSGGALAGGIIGGMFAGFVLFFLYTRVKAQSNVLVQLSSTSKPYREIE